MAKFSKGARLNNKHHEVHHHDLRVSKRGAKERPVVEPEGANKKKKMGRISEFLPKFGKLLSKDERRQNL